MLVLGDGDDDGAGTLDGDGDNGALLPLKHVLVLLLPLNDKTCNRLLLAMQNVHVKRSRVKFAKLKQARVKKFLCFQLDLWSSGLSKESYAALSASHLEEVYVDNDRKFDIEEVRANIVGEGYEQKERVLRIAHDVLDFARVARGEQLRAAICHVMLHVFLVL